MKGLSGPVCAGQELLDGQVENRDQAEGEHGREIGKGRANGRPDQGAGGSRPAAAVMAMRWSAGSPGAAQAGCSSPREQGLDRERDRGRSRAHTSMS